MSLGRTVITGGGGDLATAIAAELRTRNWEVYAPGRRELDVTDPGQVVDYFSDLEPDLLVCNAGTTRDSLLARMGEEDWDTVVNTNLTGAARCARAVVRGMAKRRSGHIIFIGSCSGEHPPAGQAAYAAAKAGLKGLALSLARELGPRNVRVNLLLPGFLETKMTSDVSPARREGVMAEHVLGRFNTVEAVAKFIHTLQVELPHTSGQVFNLDSRIV